MNGKKRAVNGGMCIIFSLLFILIGAVQFIVGQNRGVTAQMIAAIITWVYALVLLIVGFAVRNSSKQSGDDVLTSDEDEDFIQPSFTDDFDDEQPEEAPVRQRASAAPVMPEPEREECRTIEQVESKLSYYIELLKAIDSGMRQPVDVTVELNDLAADAQQLYNEARHAMQMAENNYNQAVERAGEAYLGADNKAMLLKRIMAKTDPEREDDRLLRQRARSASDKANRLSALADAQVQEAKQELTGAKEYASRVGKARRAAQKLCSRFARYAESI